MLSFNLESRASLAIRTASRIIYLFEVINLSIYQILIYQGSTVATFLQATTQIATNQKNNS